MMRTMQEQIFDLLDSSEMNWKVNKEPLNLPSGKETRFYGVVRSDNEECFGTCTDRYQVFQNDEMMELAVRLQDETGYLIQHGIVYANGARVSLDLKGKDEILEYPKVGDILEKSIRITNTHDGSGALRLAMGSTVLSCSNGMTRWVADQSTSIKHTTNMKGMVEKALIGFDVLKQEEITFMDEIKRMIDTPIDYKQVADMIFDVTAVEASEVKGGIGWSSEKHSTRSVNKAVSLLDSIKEEINYKGANAWGLLNGVTHFTTHKGGREATREDSKVFGGLMKTDKKAYDFALSLV